MEEYKEEDVISVLSSNVWNERVIEKRLKERVYACFLQTDDRYQVK